MQTTQIFHLFLYWKSYSTFKVFLAKVSILYPLKKTEDKTFSGVFSRYIIGKSARNGLTIKSNDLCSHHRTEMFLEPCQTSKRKLFAEIVTGLQPLTNFPKSSILNVWQGSESISVGCLTCFTASLISVKWWWRLKYTAWKISEFGEFLVCFSSYSDWIFILNNFISTPVFHCFLLLFGFN